MNLPIASILAQATGTSGGVEYWQGYQGPKLVTVVLSLCIGVFFASIAVLYHQLFLGGIVRRIIEKKAYSPEEAMTVEELGYNPKNILIRFALRKKSTFSKTVLRVDGPLPRFYIPEKRVMREEIKYRKQGNGVVGVFLAVAVFLLAAYVSLSVVPWFADAIKTMFS